MAARRSRLLSVVGLVIGLAGLATRADAAIIRYDFTAEITGFVNNPFLSQVSLGDQVTGHFTIDTTDPTSFDLFSTVHGAADMSFSSALAPPSPGRNHVIPYTSLTGSATTSQGVAYNPSTTVRKDVASLFGPGFVAQHSFRNAAAGTGPDVWEMKLWAMDTTHPYLDFVSHYKHSILGWKLIDPTGTAFSDPVPFIDPATDPRFKNDPLAQAFRDRFSYYCGTRLAHPIYCTPLPGGVAPTDPSLYPILSLDRFQTAILTIDMGVLGDYSIWSGRGFPTTGARTMSATATLTSLTTTIIGGESVPEPGVLTLVLIVGGGLAAALIWDRRRETRRPA